MYERIDECPVCGSTDLKNDLICKDYLISGESFAITRCFSCDLLLTNPRPDSNSIVPYYQSDQYLSHNKDGGVLSLIYRLAQTYTLRYKTNLLKKLAGPGSRLLDYGCGVGDFSAYAAQKQFSVRAIEPADDARQKAISQGLTVYPSVEQAIESEEKFDVITLWHVLEHIHELNDTIKKLRKLLRKHGHLLVAVPNVKSWDAQHYKEHWAAYDVPRHLYHFSESNLKLLFKKHNIKLVDRRPLYLDAFYISLLSEKYLTNRSRPVLSFINGCKSNIYGSRTREFSSMIYILKKK